MEPRPASGPRAPRLTIVVPSLNRARFLRATIDSVLAQTGVRVECIVVDGGSTDGSVEILRSYGDRIRWSSGPDRGHADAIDKGFRGALGDVLGWLNADDVLAGPKSAARAVEYLDAHPDIALVYGDCGVIDEAGADLHRVVRRPGWNLRDAVRRCDWWIPQPSTFFRRQAYLDVGGLDLSFAQKKDHEFWLRLGLRHRIAYDPFRYADARLTPGISQRGAEVAESCLDLTRKALAWEALPASMKRPSFRRRATSNAHLEGALYMVPHESGGDWKRATSWAATALRVDPLNAPRILARMTLAAAVETVKWVRRRARPG